MKLLLGLLFLLFALGEGEALRCFHCARTRGYSSITKVIPGYEFEEDGSWEACYEPGPFESSTQECPDGDDYACGHMKVQMLKTVQQNRHEYIDGQSQMIPYETHSATVIIKGCMHLRLENNEIGCTRDNGTIRKTLTGKLGVTESDIRGIKMRGDICYCTTSFCDPACGDHGYVVKGVCFPKWSVAATLGGLFGILVLSITCCCCCKCCRTCCCYCCRKGTKPSGQNLSGREQPYTSPTFDRRPMYIYKPLQNENPAEGHANPVYWSNELLPSTNRGSLQPVA